MIVAEIIHLIKCHKIIPKNAKLRACRKAMTSKLCDPVPCVTQDANSFLALVMLCAHRRCHHQGS